MDNLFAIYFILGISLTGLVIYFYFLNKSERRIQNCCKCGVDINIRLSGEDWKIILKLQHYHLRSIQGDKWGGWSHPSNYLFGKMLVKDYVENHGENNVYVVYSSMRYDHFKKYCCWTCFENLHKEDDRNLITVLTKGKFEDFNPKSSSTQTH